MKLKIVLVIVMLFFSSANASKNVSNMSYKEVVLEISSIQKSNWKDKYPILYKSGEAELYVLESTIYRSMRGMHLLSTDNYERYLEDYDQRIGRILREIERGGKKSYGKSLKLDEIIRLQELLEYDFYTGKNIEIVNKTCNDNMPKKLLNCKELLQRISVDVNIKIGSKSVRDLIEYIEPILKVKENLSSIKVSNCPSSPLNHKVECLGNTIEKLESLYLENEPLVKKLKWLSSIYQKKLKNFKEYYDQAADKLSHEKKRLEENQKAQEEREQGFLNIIIIVIVLSIFLIYIKYKMWANNRPTCKNCNSYNIGLNKGNLLSEQFEYQRKNGSVDKRYDNNWKHESYQGIIECLDCNSQKYIDTLIFSEKYSKGNITNEKKYNFGDYQAYFNYDGSKKNSPF